MSRGGEEISTKVEDVEKATPYNPPKTQPMPIFRRGGKRGTKKRPCQGEADYFTKIA